MNGKIVEHDAVIKSMDDGKITVGLINAKTSCSGCHARSVCAVAEVDQKDFAIIDNHTNYSEGEQIKVILEESTGPKALFLAYLFPFILLMITLITVLTITNNELTAAIASLFILGPYYLTLHLFKSRLNDVFHFKIQKIA